MAARAAAASAVAMASHASTARATSGATTSARWYRRARARPARRRQDASVVQPRAVASSERATTPGDVDPDQNALLAAAAAVGLASGLAVSAFAATEKAFHGVAATACGAVGCGDAAAFGALDPGAGVGSAIGTVMVPVVGGACVSALRAMAGGFAGEAESRTAAGRAEGDEGDASSTASARINDDFAGVGVDLDADVDDESVRAGVKVVAKTAAAAVTLGTGCSLGPEGPSVELGTALAERVSGAFPALEPSRLGVLAAGAAAGFSAGFGAPISGLFFGFESILVPGSKGAGAERAGAVTTEMVILASVLATVASKAVIGTLPSVDVPPFELVDFVELPLYLPLGLACGVTAAALRKMNVVFEDFAQGFVANDRANGGLGIPRLWHAPIGGFILGCLALKFPQVTYQGFDNVNALLVTNQPFAPPTYTPVVLGELVLAKIFATAVCRGSGLIGGVYAPSLFLGAALGIAFGGALDAAHFPSQFVAPSQAYALVAMAGVLGGVCRVPLTAILLLFELTGDYRIILPLMGTVTVATSIVNSVEANSTPLSASDIETQGVAALATSLVARPRDVMRQDFVTVTSSSSLESASASLFAVSDLDCPAPCVVVENVDGDYMGVLTPQSIADALVSGADVASLRAIDALLPVQTVEADVKLRDLDFSDDVPFVIVEESNRALGIVETNVAMNQINRERLRSVLEGDARDAKMLESSTAP